jgi:hypothetical protein
MGRDVRAAPATLAAIARALELDRDATAYLLTLAGDARAGVSLGQTDDVDRATLDRLVEGFRDGPAFVVNRRWNVVASNGAARELYAFVPSNDVRDSVVWRLLHDDALRAVHAQADAMAESVVGLIRYNYADDPESEELTELVAALEGDQRFDRAWERFSVRVFSPTEVAVRRNGEIRRFLYVASSVGRQGRETLVFHLPL